MKTQTIFRIAVFITAIVSAIACDDVYETDLGAPIESTLPTEPISVRSPNVVPRTDPVLCPEVLLESMVGSDAPDGSIDGSITPCDLPGAVCEYGSSPDRQCNQVYSCGVSGTTEWRQYPSDRCASQLCPANLSVSALEGVPCGLDGGVDDSDELLCNMSDGMCACTTGRGGSDVHERRWTCAKPLSVCPIARPQIGQPCNTGILCDYGSCRSKRGMAMTCLAGVWAATSIDCGP